MEIRLIVGLGNPGAEYRKTRHNVGFMILDHLAESLGARFRFEKAWKAEVAGSAGSGRLKGCHLLKPQTFMNLSGESVQAAARFFRLTAAQILVVLDDFSLPLGKLRLRPGGGAGGHRGLESVLASTGTPEVPRLRVGIGGPATACAPERDKSAAVVGHVLGMFRPEESAELPGILKTSTEAIECACQRGLSAAMNQYN